MRRRGRSPGVVPMSMVTAPGATTLGPATEAEVIRFFAGVSSLLPAPPSTVVAPQDLEAFLTAAGEVIVRAEARQRIEDRTQASRFNVFGLIEPDENKLSDIIADLLDPEGAHGQGVLFLRKFLEKLGLHQSSPTCRRVVVQREAPTHGIKLFRRRLDVMVDADAMVVIENKVDSAEQTDQVKDYLDHLAYCTKDNGRRGVLVYLTPNGRQPESLSAQNLQEQVERGRLACWSYQAELRQWLESCRRACEAEKIRHFLADFIAYIETDLKREPEPDEMEETDES